MISEKPARARRPLAWLSGTPFHPQWLVLRDERASRKWAGPRLCGRVLDLGCADRALERECTAVHYVGLDTPTSGYASHPDILADGHDLPFATASFDGAAALEVFEHLEEPRRCIEELHRVLRGGGALVVTVPFLYPIHDAPRDFTRWTRHGLTRIFADAGFETVEIEETGGDLATAALLANLALAAAAFERIRGVGVLLLPLVAVVVPVLNLLGWIANRLFTGGHRLPAGYRVHLRKPS